MAPIITFSGLVSSVCAFASAVAIAATFSLERCTASLRLNEVEADCTRLGAFRPDAVPDRLLGVLWHEPLELALGPLVIGMGLSGFAKQAGEFRPGVGGVHVDYAHRFDAGLRWFAIEQRRGFTGFDRPPEGLFSGDQDGLIDRVGLDRELNPLAVAVDNRKHRFLGAGDQHVVLK